MFIIIKSNIICFLIIDQHLKELFHQNTNWHGMDIMDENGGIDIMDENKNGGIGWE